MEIHEIKVWPPYYKDLVTGKKKFELRKNDRNYEVGDFVTLREWCNITEKYSGSSFQIRISYILSEPVFGLKIGYCIFSWKN